MLTLYEVLQTFEVESPMFNINYNRTVVLKKNFVEIEGAKKLIVMMRDVTDKVTLEEE